MKSRDDGERRRGKRGKERIAGLVHMFVSCVNWRSLLLLGFPWRRGIFIGGWQLQWMDPCSVTPTNIIIITLYVQKWKMSATWEAFRDSACMHCVSLPNMSVPHAREKRPAGETLAFVRKRQKKEARRQNRRKNRKTGGSWHASRGVCNLIYWTY